MSQPLRQIESAQAPPKHADVVVIGGGIIGVFTAYYLAQLAIWASSSLRYSKPQRLKPVSAPVSAAN